MIFARPPLASLHVSIATPAAASEVARLIQACADAMPDALVTVTTKGNVITVASGMEERDADDG